MAGVGQYTRIAVNGEQLMFREIVFVVFNPDGKAVDYVESTASIRDSIARAARTHWVGDTNAIEKLNDGWRIKIMSKKDMLKNHGADLIG